MSTSFRHDHARCGGGHFGEGHEHGYEGSGAHEAGRGRPFAFAGSPRHFERARPFAIEHLFLDLALDFGAKSVAGTAKLKIKRVDPEATELSLDAVAFTIHAVTLDEKNAKYTYDGRTILVELPHDKVSATLAIRYEATPRKGLYFLEPDEHVPGRPRQAWTQCQEEDARHFFPCHDKPHVKMTTETRVRVPAGFTVLSNGELVSRDAKGGEATFHFAIRDPHPSYLVTIVAGDFAEITEHATVAGEGKKTRDVPIAYLIPKGREDDAHRTFGRTPAMVEHFSSLLGVPYPWSRYSQVVVSDFIFGGMENTTATTLYEHVLLDARAALDVTSDDLIAHELAHQWFGDYVTCRDWSEGWLNEGFATYMEHVWREKAEGRDEYEYGIKNDLGSYLAEAHGRYLRPIVCQDYDAPLDLFDRHLYEKGGLVLHALRTALGDALFWKGVHLYLSRHARGLVETRDLLRALEETSGRSLGRMFEELVFKPGHPELNVELSWADGVLTCAVKQTQTAQEGVPSVFEVPLTLAIGDRTERVTLSSRSDSFAIPCKERPAWVVVDPEMRVIGDVTVKAAADMLRAQLASANTARGRWLAAQALSRNDDPVSIAALARSLGNEKEFWGVRAECAAALGALRAREAFAALSEAIDTKHPKVRRAVASAVGRFKTTQATEVLKSKALRDESYLVEAEAARALGGTRQSVSYDVLIDVIDRPSWADVIAASAIDGLAALRDERALPHLYARTRYGHPSRVRRAAVLAIPKLSTDRRAREHIEELLEDPDPILRMDVVRALADLGDARSRGPLRARAERDLDPRVRRRIREALRDLGGDRKKTDHVRDDLDKLQTEHAELKARVAKLEALASPEEKKDAKKARKSARRAVNKRKRR